MDKLVAGAPLPALGLLLDRSAWRIVCPSLKRASMLADVRAQRADARGPRTALRARVRRLTGRLCNLSQIYPELLTHLHGGYALSEAAWWAGGRRRRPEVLKLGCGSAAQAAG